MREAVKSSTIKSWESEVRARTQAEDAVTAREEGLTQPKGDLLLGHRQLGRRNGEEAVAWGPGSCGYLGINRSVSNTSDTGNDTRRTQVTSKNNT